MMLSSDLEMKAGTFGGAVVIPSINKRKIIESFDGFKNCRIQSKTPVYFYPEQSVRNGDLGAMVSRIYFSSGSVGLPSF
jgi:hypothetical protein